VFYFISFKLSEILTDFYNPFTAEKKEENYKENYNKPKITSTEVV